MNYGKHMKTKRILSLLLAAVMIFSGFSFGETVSHASEKPKVLTTQTKEAVLEETKASENEEQAAEPAELANFEDVSEESGFGTDEFEEPERISEILEENLPAEEEIVDFMVVLDIEPLLSKFTSQEILAGSDAAKAYEEEQMEQIIKLEKALKEAFGDEEGFRLGFQYTISTTGVSVKTRYGNQAIIEGMPGVEKVYISPSFEIASKDVVGYTNNASTMIGATELNDTGYTGKGMKIAIIDTGIVVDHPSFGALSEEQLTEDSMTKAEVAEVWDSLNASRTNFRNAAYHNSKIPFIFNYDGLNFDVSHATASHDHGTHVAGIAAANKIDSTDVVGVAPEAQLIVMQVFNRSGGAEWSTILAALEDCVKLDVDTVNLSLGSPAGFTDGDLEMAAVLSNFERTDIQVVIAGGNDTNNAYMNLTGTDLSKTKNPDTGIVGTPATSTTALAVASADNDGADLLYFTVGDRKIGFSDSAVNEATNFFENHRNASLEFVHIEGYGRIADYAGVNVEGKVAVVSRGEISFQEKQAAAKEAGAKAVVVYNNVPGSFAMAISDGSGHIPCVAISKSDGEYLKNQGSGTLTVCNGDLIHTRTDRAMSDFSSWGATPDLKLKPEISGVGGNIYSARDIGLSGSNYGSMSGTSMASPQVAGAITVLTQYLKENYEHVYGSEQELRHLAANLLMSTASQIQEGSYEYSPRKQGAGLVDLKKATVAGAYLTNPDMKEKRPKAELGDNSEGVYEFNFEIHNMSDAPKQYRFESSVLSPDAKDGFMRNELRALEAELVIFEGSTVKEEITVAANSSVRFNAKLNLTTADKELINQDFENGTYVEGYLYLKSADEQGVDLSMPFLGFYGEWSDAPVFDDAGEEASLYAPVVYTLLGRLGENPYIKSGKGGDDYNAISYVNPLDEMVFGMMRNSKKVGMEVRDKETDKQYFYYEEDNIIKTYYSAAYGMIIPYSIFNYNEEVLIWDGRNGGASLPDGTRAVYSIHSYLDDGDQTIDDTYQFEVTIDNTKPQILNAGKLSEAVIKDYDQGTVQLPLTITENHYLAAVIFESLDGTVLGKYEVENKPGEAKEYVFDITGYGTDFTVIAADYACNETEIDLSINLNDMPTTGNPKKLDGGRIYGNETNSDGNVSRGWFSADKETFTDIRNETFDTEGTTFAAEYINGYVIAQSTSDASLVMLTPYNTYWKSTTLWTQTAEVYQDGFVVFYDMALDHEEDKLYAIGWDYGGDSDGDGKDDGGNTLFEIILSQNGDVEIEPKARISGLEAGIESLTLGCTTEGQLYTISTDGKLYKLENDGTTNYVGTTDFVEEPNYSGVNVIQSMGYDHENEKMYWFAHSQTPQGNSYLHVGGTYEVDLTDASSSKVGGNSFSGYTSLFVPNDLNSEIFTPNVVPTGIEITPNHMVMAAGQTRPMEVKWKPWNALPGEVTWESKNPAVAQVNQNGVVKAVSEGITQICASAQIEENGESKTIEFAAEVEVLAASGAIYGYAINDYDNAGNNNSWLTYSDDNLKNVTNISSDGTMWQGGTYYNGYIYHVVFDKWEENQVMYQGTSLYRSKVIPGETPGQTRFTERTLIGTTKDIEVGNLGFDYNTGRMYGVDYTNGGLCIIDIDSGAIDLLGTFSGDLQPAIMTAMCVTAKGNIIGADMFGNLYQVNPDTLHCTKLGSIESDSWFYAAMTYDHNTGNIYWNPCMDKGASDFYLVRIDDENLSPTTTEIISLGGVSGDQGTEQTVLFTIPTKEPETTYIPIEDIEIVDGDSMIGLQGGSMQLKTQTTPIRPSVGAKTWKSSNENVVKVDHFGNVSFHDVGSAEVTVTISGKGENAPGPFTDTITIRVYEAAGEFAAFLAHDEMGSHYFDFWLNMKDYEPRKSELRGSMIGTYTLRTGEYFDGYFYAYNDAGQFYRINEKNVEDYVTIGSHGLGQEDQVVSMTFDYTEGKMYALTLPRNSSPGYLGEVNLNTGAVTKLHKLDKCITAFAVDEKGTLYGAGQEGPFETASLYTIDKENGSCTLIQQIPGASVYTGENYYGTVMYNSQMTYDYGTKRLYLNATRSLRGYDGLNTGLYLIQLTEEEDKNTVTMIENLGKPGVLIREEVKDGHVFLGLFCAVPEAEEVQGDFVTAVILERTAARAQTGDQIQLRGQISPTTAENKNIRWSSENEAIASVDENGLVSAKAPGTVKIYAVSEANAQIQAVCTVTIVEKDTEDKTTVAYTISGDQEALVAFDLELPSTSARKLATVSGGRRIVGVDVKSDNYLYYLVDTGIFPQLYRFDMTTKRSTSLGELEVFIGDASDMAYDPVHKLIYVVSGFYVFQFEEDRLQPGTLNRYSGYLDTAQKSSMPLSNLHAVTCVDGQVYFIASANGASLYSVDDELKNLTLHRKVAVNTVSGECEMAYDSNSERFILSDAGHRLYSFTKSGEDVEMIDFVGDGWDVNGLGLNTGGNVKLPESTPVPTKTPTPEPTETQVPIETPTDTPGETPVVTETPIPAETEIPEKVVTEIFEDVYEDWYTEYIQYVYENNLMKGIEGTKLFEPNGEVTRAQVAQVIYNMEGKPEVLDRSACTELTDVYEDWYTDAVCWTYANEIVTGHLDTMTFEPNDPVTREQLALMLYRYTGYLGYERDAFDDLSNLKNGEAVSAWAKEAICWAVGAELIQGIELKGEDGQTAGFDLAPQNGATRAQVAAIFMRYQEKFVK